MEFHTLVGHVKAKSVLSVPDEYSTLACSYEQQWRRYLEVTASHTLAALDPKSNERILDAGCGTGMLLRRIAAHTPRADLVGIDLTAAMVHQVDAALFGLAVADLRRLPLADESFDAVVIASVLQYLPALAPALSEAVRVVRPGGRVVITAWDGGSRRMQILGRWLRWCDGADVHLHTLHDFIAECHRHRLSLRRRESYSVGRIWRLLTLVAVKNVGGCD